MVRGDNYILIASHSAFNCKIKKYIFFYNNIMNKREERDKEWK